MKFTPQWGVVLIETARKKTAKQRANYSLQNENGKPEAAAY
jgi:hypothetical protein